MTHNLAVDIAQHLEFIQQVLSGSYISVFNTVGCYDPTLEDKWQWECPGGVYMLLYERLPEYGEKDLLYQFMWTMKTRGITEGIFYIHTKCLYLFMIRGVTTVEGQEQEAAKLSDLVERYNADLGVSWQVIVESGGSAPIS